MILLKHKRNKTSGLTIIYFCLGDKWQDWQERGFANRTASIALELAYHPRVLRLIVVNNPTSYAAVLRDRARITYKMFGARDGLRKRSPHLDSNDAKSDRQFEKPRRINRHGIHGYFIDHKENCVTVIEQIRFFPRERSNTATFTLNNILYDADVVRLLQGYLAEEGDSPLVLWVNSPVFAKFAGNLGEDLFVYDARDDWIYHPQLKPIQRALQDGYNRVYKKADIVFAVSKSLVKTFSGGRSDVFLIPNGIDPRLFNDVASGVKRFGNTASDVGKLIDLRRPIVGYVGKMQDRFNVELMVEVVERMTDTSFVFVGPVFTPELFEPLKKLPNVFFTGRVHQTQVPVLINHFDVCIMPHVKDRLTAAMNPLKLYEYLALGKPTVCTGASDLEQFDGLIEIADDAEEFGAKIRSALDEPMEKKSARMKFAEKQQWSKRVKSMVKEIDRKLLEKASKS